MSRRQKIILAILGILALCCFTVLAIAVINPGGILSTSTPTPTSTPTFTLTPTDTITPTSTLTPSPIPTDTPLSTETLTPTATIIFILPTNPQGAVCPCSGDTLNCTDFSSQSSAQACMDYCKAQGAGDIHNLDGDANGLACEGLP